MTPAGNGITPDDVTRWRKMEVEHNRMMLLLDGENGLIARLNDLLTRKNEREKTLEEVQAKRHEENQLQLQAIRDAETKRTLTWTIAGVLVGVAAVIVAVFFGIAAVKLTRNQPIHLFSNRPVFSSSIKAIIPPL